MMNKSLSALVASVAMQCAAPVVHADTFVLVHGAFQSASAWGAVAEELRAAGHSVAAVDLPGRNAEGTEAAGIALQDYIDTTLAAVEAAGEQVILVGHSFGGMTISGVAEAAPDLVDLLIYVAAYLPQSGETMEALALSDHDNGFSEQTFVIAPDYSHATILAADQVRVFAQDADETQAAELRASMIREPLAPIATPISLTEERFGTVDIAYIRTLADQTVSTALQTMMIDRAGVEWVRDLDTGHAPYLTQPAALAAMLIDLADRQ